MYKVGELIHHANRGLCKVADVTRMKTSGNGEEKEYYKLIPLDSAGDTVFTPVDNPKVQMRRALTREDADHLIGEMQSIDPLRLEDEKKLETICRGALASIDCRDWVGLIKALYLRRTQRVNEGKKVTASEERCFQSATGRLHTELALAIGIQPERVEEYIAGRLQ